MTTRTPRQPTSPRYLRDHDYKLTVVGLPKTIDNDIIPIKHSLGAWTAAEEGARFARNVVAEHNSNSRTLIVHEVMGRNCGWLTAATAEAYDRWLNTQEWMPDFGLTREAWGVHGVYVPEAAFDLESESDRLKHVMDTVGNVTVFLSEGAGVESIVAELEQSGADVPRDPFGHVRLDEINPGAVVREAVRRPTRRREGSGPEVGLLRPLRAGR